MIQASQNSRGQRRSQQGEQDADESSQRMYPSMAKCDMANAPRELFPIRGAVRHDRNGRALKMLYERAPMYEGGGYRVWVSRPYVVVESTQKKILSNQLAADSPRFDRAVCGNERLADDPVPRLPLSTLVVPATPVDRQMTMLRNQSVFNFVGVPAMIAITAPAM